jgi:sugar phosphate permease
MAQQDKSWDTSYEWKIIALLSVTFGLVGLDRFILPVILQSPNSTMAADLGLTAADGATLAGTLGIAWGISAFVMGYMADKLGRRAVLVPAILVFSLMSVFSGMAGAMMSLLIIRIIMGVADLDGFRHCSENYFPKFQKDILHKERS